MYKGECMEEKVLFKDDIRESKDVLKYMKKVRISILVFMIFFFVLTIFLFITCLVKEKYLELISSGVTLLIAILLLLMFFNYSKKNYAYLYIYETRIVVKCYGKKEQVFNVKPDEYFIRVLKPFPINLKYGITLEIQDKKYNVLVKYKSLTLYPSEKNKPQLEWEKELFSIGCKVTDRENLIINK